MNDDIFFVTSQANSNKGYEVNYVFHHCECKAKELEPTQDCKHLLAISYMKQDILQKAFTAAMVKAVSKITNDNRMERGLLSKMVTDTELRTMKAIQSIASSLTNLNSKFDALLDVMDEISALLEKHNVIEHKHGYVE